jgi:AraC-like DNA-binding protein
MYSLELLRKALDDCTDPLKRMDIETAIETLETYSTAVSLVQYLTWKMKDLKDYEIADIYHVHPGTLKRYKRKWGITNKDIQRYFVEKVMRPLAQQGYTMDKIAKTVGIAPSTLYRRVASSMKELNKDVIR